VYNPSAYPHALSVDAPRLQMVAVLLVAPAIPLVPFARSADKAGSG
jgi:hypothetical protein